MRKRIAVDQLRPGMCVVSADRGWLRVPFVRKFVSDETVVEALKRERVGEVVIDTDRGEDLAGPRVSPSGGPAGLPETLAARMAEASQLRRRAMEKVGEMTRRMSRGEAFDESDLSWMGQALVEKMREDPMPMLSVSALSNDGDYHASHSVSLAVLTLHVAKSAGCSVEEMTLLAEGALLHDIGKGMAPEALLRKPGKLTPEEAKVVRMHAVLGAEYLQSRAILPKEVVWFVSHHHERMNGSGYPNGLRGDDISWHGRVGGLLDVYDALVHENYYKDSADPAFVLKLMGRWVGDLYDPEAYGLLANSMGPYPVGTVLLLDTGELAVSCQPNGSISDRPVVALVSYTDGSPRRTADLTPLTDKDGVGEYRRTVVKSIPLQEVHFNPLTVMAGAA